eukprot:2184856-Pleurochrysis_carterae.AAC.2
MMTGFGGVGVSASGGLSDTFKPFGEVCPRQALISGRSGCPRSSMRRGRRLWDGRARATSHGLCIHTHRICWSLHMHNYERWQLG